MSYTLGMENENEIKRLIELCGCEVVLDSRDDRLSTPGFSGCKGSYWWSEEIRLPNIELGPAVSAAARLACLAHEVGHALCETKHCSCEAGARKVRGTTTLSEYHAMKFASKWLLDNRCLDAMQNHISLIEAQASRRPSPHRTGARRLMKLKLWEKCKNYADDRQ